MQIISCIRVIVLPTCRKVPFLVHLTDERVTGADFILQLFCFANQCQEGILGIRIKSSLTRKGRCYQISAKYRMICQRKAKKSDDFSIFSCYVPKMFKSVDCFKKLSPFPPVYKTTVPLRGNIYGQFILVAEANFFELDVPNLS